MGFFTKHGMPDVDVAKQAIRKAMDIGHGAGAKTALTLSAGSGPRRDAPEMRLTLAVQYLF